MTLIATAADPIPEGALTQWLSAKDDTRIRVARWTPASAARGTVVVLNGRGEFIEKYFEVIGDLLARGFAVATMDWRGQGLSDRPLANRHKGHVADFSLFIDDLQLAMQSFIDPVCPSPYVLVCHSMGGNISLRYLAQQPAVFRAALFTAPMWGIGKATRPGLAPRLLAAGSAALGMSTAYLPFAGGDFDPARAPFENNVLTSDRERYERFHAQLKAEPRLALGSPTVGWTKRAFDSIDALHTPGFAEAIETPIRVCTAGADALVSNAAQRAIAERLPNARQVVIEGARHELLVELDRYRDRTFGVFDELMAEVGI